MGDGLVVRSMERSDLPAVARILDRTGLFPTPMLSEMAEPFLSGAAPHNWLVAIRDGELQGFAYAEPERMTLGSFNLLAIAVDPDRQGRGIGKAIVAALTDRLRPAGGRILLVETSSLEDYAATRGFYAMQGFTQEARISDFYQDGEDKIIFWKRL